MPKIKNTIILVCLFIGIFFVFIAVSYSKIGHNQQSIVQNDQIKEEPQQTKTATFLFLGDLMIDRYVGTLIKKKKSGVDYLLEKIIKQEKDFFNGYDVISANLEGAVTDKGEHYLPKYANDFAFSPEKIKVFKNYNFNFFNLANNHFSDQGARGVTETETNLTNLDIPYSGCTDGKTGDCSYKIINAGDFEVAMVGFSMVYKTPDEGEMVKIIEKAKKESDKIIINIHWGSEYTNKYSKKQQSLAYKLIDAGADLIIGHHPHVVQGMEFYKEKAIFYSLGNFIFDQYFSSNTQQGLALGVYFNGENTNFFLYPLKSQKSQVALMNDNEKKIFFKKFFEWSKTTPQIPPKAKLHI